MGVLGGCESVLFSVQLLSWGARMLLLVSFLCCALAL